MAWFTSFVVLARLGTWTTFAAVGVALAAPLILLRMVPWVRLRPNQLNVRVGLLSGLLMVVLTQLVYRSLCAFAPDVGAATARLMDLLNVSGFSAGSRAGLIMLIARCEEILFRGALPGRAVQSAPPMNPLSTRELAKVVALAAAYALTTTPLGSPLLLICALLCGSLWGVLGLATGSLVAPILAHVVWDLGVLIVWPLPA
ncbi:MAG TPA: CPBP family glutamic-type intramembrane protease [Polyangiaceae bacterium]|nr:CPBP family glutamic-type intramembrane protease [Polyangiaceae bacterium]